MRPKATELAVDAALVAVCMGRTPDLPDSPDARADFVEAVRYHRIAPLAHVMLRQSVPEVAAELRTDRDEALMNHLRASALLSTIAQTLAGIPWLVFKGPMLAEFAHPIPGLRFYKDLDLLVAPSDFRDACHRMMSAGWKALVGEDSIRGSELPGELPMVDEHAVVLDLHWSMMVMKSLRGRFRVEAAPLLARRVPVTLGPTSLWALDPVDALIHVCHHAALAGATKLGHLLDADQLARQVTDWDAVVVRARQWRATAEVAIVLGRASRRFDTPVPVDLDRRLGLARWLSFALVRIDETWPIESLRHDESWVRLITRSLRPGLINTVVAMTRRVAKGVWVRAQASPQKRRKPPRAELVEAYLSRVDALDEARRE